MKPNTNYRRCQESTIPHGVRFDVPAANRGQMVEVAYGTTGRAQAGEGSPWKRVTEAGCAPRYYDRVGEEWVEDDA